MKILASVKALIVKDDKILIIQDNDKDFFFWDLPGGAIEGDETPKEALIREVKEEVGLEIEIKEIVGMYWVKRSTTGNRAVYTVFKCSPLTYKIDIGNNPAVENITDYKWVTKDEFLKLPMFDESLRDLINSL